MHAAGCVLREEERCQREDGGVAGCVWPLMHLRIVHSRPSGINIDVSSSP